MGAHPPLQLRQPGPSRNVSVGFVIDTSYYFLYSDPLLCGVYLPSEGRRRTADVRRKLIFMRLGRARRVAVVAYN